MIPAGVAEAGANTRPAICTLMRSSGQFQLAGAIVPDHSLLKTQEHVDGIKKSAVINMACLDAVSKEIGAGMPTKDIDKDRLRGHRQHGRNSRPAPL